jgi:hypothetical protein
MNEFEAHQWDLDHPEEAAALDAARIEEARALGIEVKRPKDSRAELERATAEGRLSGLVVSDHCAVCGSEVEVHLARSVCSDCR